jgi:(p)ppGpp synthase/HD superfamily hydrolase
MNLVRQAVTLSRKILTPRRADHAHRVASLLIHPTQEELAAAYLHDILEDTDYKEETLRERFGKKVAAWVVALTNSFEGYSRVRDFSYLKDACSEVKRIKLADRIDNIKKRVYQENPPDYSDYVKETEKLLEATQDGDANLAALLKNLTDKLRDKCAKYEHGNVL